ncbi:MAG TPA: hypothetical protein EYP53_05680 [Candidatus Latescibacteria bacterium]|nr:hypothetical protein [Candidatus Latescibacterota bacterium]
MKIDANGLYYKDLNEKIYQAVVSGKREIVLENVNGQRYIGGGLRGDVKVVINGVPGNDLASFMDGPTIIVKSNGQDGIGNTMNAGRVVVYGDAGDIIGYSMRGGRIYIKGDVGYRVGIHMKSYKGSYPVVIIGGCARDFLGEYMAGGLLIILGLNRGDDLPIVGNYVGTGMHGGLIYIRGELEDYQLGKEVGIEEPSSEDLEQLEGYLEEYCNYFGLNVEDVQQKPFLKLYPRSHRPYGRLYAY